MARWKLNGLFKRKKAVKAPPPAPAAIQPLVRETRPKREETLLPRFQATASDQPSMRSADRFANMRARIRYAFTPSQPVGDRRMFAGRQDVLRSIIRAIEDQRLHVVVYGERGIGKTSLLRMLSLAAAEARYIVIYTSCGADANFDDTFRAAAADIPVLFHSAFAPTAEQSERGATLADLLPTGPLTPRQFADLCAKLTGTRVLIVVDEFDRCTSPIFRRDVAELIKNLSDRLGRVQLVLAGVAADLTQLVAHIPSIRRNIFALRVPQMSDAEVLEIVGNGEREVGLTFDPPARELVVAIARGSPYIAALLCHHAAQTAIDEGRSTVLAPDVSHGVEQTYAEFHGRLSKAVHLQIERLMEQGHRQDIELAARTALSLDGPIAAADVAGLNQCNLQDAAAGLKCLAAEGLLTEVDTGDGVRRYAFGEDGLPSYLWIESARHKLQEQQGGITATRRRAAGSSAN